MKKYIIIFIFLIIAFMSPCPGFAASSVSSQSIETFVSSPQLDISVDRGSLVITSSEASVIRIMIYSITGQSVKNFLLAPGETTRIELPKGYYIVKSPTTSKRILVQ